jgi:hypothetical protein
MALPSIVPTGYLGTFADFLHCKVDRSGAKRLISVTQSIPAATLSTATIGLFPFQVGAKVSDLQVYCASVDTSAAVSLEIGVLYQTNTANNATLYVSATTLPQVGGFVPLASFNNTGMGYITLDSGWVVAQFTGAATNVIGNLKCQASIVYDQSGITN